MIVGLALGLCVGMMLWEWWPRTPHPPLPTRVYVLGRRPGRTRAVYWYDAQECVDCCIAPDPKPWREEFDAADQKVLDEILLVNALLREKW